MNIVYNASAGTGKTYQVTQLYEKLVMEDGIDPREILLMTFTENAASELRMRVAHSLLRARSTAEAEGNDEKAERAISASAKLASAPIGTIHSFCTRLLREHALEAGLSPGFSTLVGDEREELLNRICRDHLLEHLATDPDFKDFCAGAHLIGTGNGFGSSVTETVPALIGEAGSLGISLEQAEALLPEPVEAPPMEPFCNILNRLNELPKLTADAQKVKEALEANLARCTNAEALTAHLLQAGLKKFGRGKGQKPISDDFTELLERSVAALRYRERFPAARAFARYLQSVAITFQQRKHAMDTVDFDDQLRMAADLLKTGKAVPAFHYVIVDEVQDTSRIQCDLIQSLWGPETNLVICGDKKQSIYTWRGADPQVMPDLENAIRANENSRCENLQTSYRSKAPILDVINALFSSIYGPEAYAESDHLQANPAFVTDDEKPGVEFLAPDADEEWSKQEKVAAEMEAVANRIRLLVEGPENWKPAYRYKDGFEPLSENNTYRYSDILILLRRTTHQSVLEQALRHAGIPYTLGGKGRGLFTRQETRDVSLFLNVLTNPKDVYSLVGFLRSPWIGLSDEVMADLAWRADGFSVEALIGRYPEKTDVVDRYRAQLGTRLASELVRQLIEETGYDALLAGLPRGTQRLANLRKILDWLRETERGAHTTPAAVARKLAEQIANPPQIPEAALLDPAQNAVTIMTVHGAKGLTKRVVVVPDISSSPKNDTAFCRVFMDETTPRLGIKITAPNRSSVESPGFKDAKKRAQAVRDHEQKNLFYVAMTRARDLVITSASVGAKPAGWRAQIEPLLGKEIPVIPYAALAHAVEQTPDAPRKTQSAQQLAAALAALPPAPPQPQRQRIPATRFAKEQDETEPDPFDPERPAFRTSPTSAALGSLGHAVLEQLALNDWQGSIPAWLDLLRPDFCIEKAEAASLMDRIEQTRQLMMGLTADTQTSHPEFPFVLHHENHLIDGTIDLLCKTDQGVSIFDYKFTEADESTLQTQYRNQMEIYRRAAQKRHPQAQTVAIRLIVISAQDVKTLPMIF
jgi:ATP-dependent helicase/nuclease subunit A